MQLQSMQKSTARAALRAALWAALAILTSIMEPAATQALSAGEDGPAGILAVRLREQGHRCDEPARAEPDAARSRADERAWIVKCANASYRMRLIPDMGAVI